MCGHGKGSVTMGVVTFILCWCTCRYSEQSGRESVIEFLVIVFKKFPEVYVIAVGGGEDQVGHVMANRCRNFALSMYLLCRKSSTEMPASFLFHWSPSW